MTLKLVVTLVEVVFAGCCYEKCALLLQVLKSTHKTHTQLQKIQRIQIVKDILTKLVHVEVFEG